MKTKLMRGLLVGAVLVAAAGQAAAETPYPVAWSRQLGTSVSDRSESVAADGSGSAFISGYTYGSLGGTNAGNVDAFLAKYDNWGTLLWQRQIGTSSSDYSYSVAVDGSGNAFISGYTNGSLFGTNAGSYDAFLAKYNSSGTFLWAQQLGTSEGDQSRSVAVDGSGNAFISGMTSGSLGGTNAGGQDAFLVKYDSSGNLLWTRQLGTSGGDESRSVAVDGSGNAFISGMTGGSLGGPSAGQTDAFLAKYDSSGNPLWARQLGTAAADYCFSVAVDRSGSAFISGFTYGSLGGSNAGQTDAFLAKYDSLGNLLWTRQLGTASGDLCYSVAVDDSGSVFISGRTDGSLGGPNAGSQDAFLAKYDSSGNLLWCSQVGSSLFDESGSVAADLWGRVFISGHTQGSLGGPHAGDEDAFLVKFTPEPCTLSLLVLGGLLALRRRR